MKELSSSLITIYNFVSVVDTLMKQLNDLVGLIPAGGQALRLGNLPCSKEIYPLQLWSEKDTEPRVISEYLVKYYKLAGCSHIYFILISIKNLLFNL